MPHITHNNTHINILNWLLLSQNKPTQKHISTYIYIEFAL